MKLKQHAIRVLGLIGIVSALHPGFIEGATTSVGDHYSLTDAIASAADGDTILLTNNITVEAEVVINAKGITIDGDQHSLSVPSPGLSESGVLNSSPSAFRVFHLTATGKTNTIQNMAVKGGAPGSSGGGILNYGGTLVLQNVSISQSGGPSWGAGGVYNNAGTLIMRDCNVSRNAAKYGGGFMNAPTGSTMLMERCTFSENRSLDTQGGGGAGQNNGTLYANNCTFANNKSTELGGAFNNRPSASAYFVGCTFAGNVAYGTYAGGGIANNGGTITLVNSLLAYNYRNLSGTYVLDDLNNYSGTAPVAYYCVLQSTANQLGAASVGVTMYSGNITGSDDSLFCAGATAKVLAPNGTEVGSGTVYQPFLAKTSASKMPAAILQLGSFAIGKGVRSAFSASLPTPVVGYYNGNSWVALSGSNPESFEVMTDQNGDARASSLTVGAVNSTTANLFMLKVNAAANGSVSGGTIYGDIYSARTSVTVTAIPANGYAFSEWDYVLGGSGVASTGNPFTITLTTNVTLLPVFAAYSGFTVTYSGNGFTGGVVPSSQVVNSGNTAVIASPGNLTRTAYSFAGWNTRSDGTGTDFAPDDIYSGPNNLDLYAKWTLIPSPTIITPPASQKFAAGENVSITVSAAGNTPLSYQWFKDRSLVPGATNSTLSLSNADVSDSGVYYAVVTNDSGLRISSPALLSIGSPKLLAWGDNSMGQLGDYTTTGKQLPAVIDTNVVTAATGERHSVYLKDDGTVWAMGDNGSGELGNSTTSSSSNAVSMVNGTNSVMVAAGRYHSLFLKSDGTLWGAGLNGLGQLGVGDYSQRTTPVAVASNVVSVVAGYYFSLFLKDDGTLWGMGYNNLGQLGDGTLTTRTLPVCVASNVVTMAAGGQFSLYLKVDATLWGTGYNYYGQITDGTTIDRSNFVCTASNVISVAAGYVHSLYVTGDGRLWTVGGNSSGQLGDGTTTSRSNMVSVATNVVSASPGGFHSLFMKEEGMAFGFGGNFSGQLGDGTKTMRTTPVLVKGITFASIASGETSTHTLGVGEPLPPSITSQPTNQVITAGNAVTFRVVATGFAPLAYQWQHAGTNLPGTTSTNYTIASGTSAHAGDYTVVVTNSVGSVTSSVAVLTVNKRTVTVTTWPVASLLDYGQTLAAAELTGGSASVPGSFSFTAPETLPPLGVTAQDVLFTPADPSIYNTASGSVNVTVLSTGQAPIAVVDSLGTHRNQAVTLSATKLTANDTDADGDPLTITAVSTTSAFGGTVFLEGTSITYTPPADAVGADSFTYTISDGHGNNATGTVNVSITSSTGVSLNVVFGPTTENGEFVVRFAGTPGYTYTIEYTDSLAEPINWQKRTNLTAPTTPGNFGKGVFEFREDTGGAGSRYYRTVYPAY